MALGGEGKTSLVARWAVDQQIKHWKGCEAAFAWSFYSQGADEKTATSSDLFLKEALTFFGDPTMASSPQGGFEKGRRLAHLVGERRALLILDGLEPLQYAPTSPTAGELKDQGLAALLKGLAASNRGLCVVTTRYSLPDLRAYWQSTAPEHELKSLTVNAGIDLLKKLGVKGTPKEFQELVEDVDGHALTLILLGGFLKRAFHGDIRQRDRVKFEKADEKIQGGHAFRAMAAYEEWLLEGGDEGRREVAILRLMGLFDRPADAGCLQALRSESIPNLTEPLVGLGDDDWEFSLTGLEATKLLTVNRDAAGTLVSLDAHPLLREYFAGQLRQQYPEAWRAGHRRLYEHLCATTKEGDQPTLEDLQPLYQAVAHGCQAGLQQEACEKVYAARIIRGNRHYSWRQLGSFGSDLGAVACFFDPPWSRVSPSLEEAHQAWLLHQTALYLPALGRLSESAEPQRAAIELMKRQENWGNAAIAASNLSDLELTLGEVAAAVGDAEQSVTYADRSGGAFQRMVNRTTHANALHQAGRKADAEALLREAEQMQAERQPKYMLLYSRGGFGYCDLLLTEAERTAWQRSIAILPVSSPGVPLVGTGEVTLPERTARSATLRESCRAVSERGKKMFEWRVPGDPLLDIARDHLTLGRAALYAAILENTSLDPCHSPIEHAVSGLRRSGYQDHLPLGLLTRAWLRCFTGPRTGPESAQSDLDEAWEIAERGPMRLHMADIHLHRARLFFRDAQYPWESPRADLDAAKELIEKCGYGRRKEELEDAEAAIRDWKRA